jgi:hypothetical protein
MILALLTTFAMAGDFCAVPDKVEELQTELSALFDVDRDDHASNRYPAKLAKLDKQRSAYGYKLHKSGKLCNADMQFFAAGVMVRSEKRVILDAAYTIAKVAMMEHVHRSAWLTAVAYDRRQISQGLPQRYGTQLNMVDGKVCMYPFEAGVTDSERKQYDIPPIVDAYQRVLDGNGLDRELPTFETLDAKDLFCELEMW